MRLKGARPTCHPDRAHQALGLCKACYLRQYRDPANAHTHRSYTQPSMDLTPYDPETFIPTQIEGVQQNAVFMFPLEACPKCHNSSLAYNGREVRCAFGCGSTYYLVREVPHPVPAVLDTVCAVNAS